MMHDMGHGMAKMDHANHEHMDHDMSAMQEEKHEGHKGHDMSKMSHMNHEAAMTNPQMAKAMEADMRRRFFISLILSGPV